MSNEQENNVERVFQQAGANIASRTAISGGKVYELTSPDCPDLRVAVLHTAHKGLTLGVRFELAQTGLASTRADSEQALLLLGVLTAGLQPQGVEAHLLAGKQGLEGILVSVHFCHEKVEPAQLKAQLARLRQIAGAIAKAVEQEGPARLEAVRRAATLAEAAAADVSHVKVSVAPTFDLAARDRLLQKAGLKGA